MKLRVFLFFTFLFLLAGIGIFLIVSDPRTATFTTTLSPSPSASPALVLGISQSPLPQRESAVVKKVIDGDTIELQDGRKVLYIGMNTPETHHPQKGVECYGKEAAARNAELVANKTVQLEKDVSETDRYGRLLRYVWVDDVFINKQLVDEGFAMASSYPPDITKQPELRQAEAIAREQKKGLWASCPH